VAAVGSEDGDLACWVLAYVVGASAALPVVAGLVGVAAFLEGLGFACGVEGVGVEGEGYGGAVVVEGGDDVGSAVVFCELLFGHGGCPCSVMTVPVGAPRLLGAHTFGALHDFSGRLSGRSGCPVFVGVLGRGVFRGGRGGVGVGGVFWGVAPSVFRGACALVKWTFGVVIVAGHSAMGVVSKVGSRLAYSFRAAPR